MSRSRRKHPVRQLCSNTQKEWKRSYNRALRRRNKVLAARGSEDYSTVKDVSDIWTSPSDGWIAYWDHGSEREKRSWWDWEKLDAPEALRAKWKAQDERWEWKLWTK